MIELTILCEGPTEFGFVRDVLKPHLNARQVHCKPIELNKKNFGVVPWESLKKAIQGSIGNSKAHQYTTCMIDLYALPDYPGQAESVTSPIEKVRNIESHMQKQLPNPRWLPYIQLHEFEALLYVDLSAIASAISDRDVKAGVASLSAEVDGKSPEDVNEGAQTAPSKRILKHIPEYAKAQVGPSAAMLIGLDQLRHDCPHFGEWLTMLEALPGKKFG